MWIEELKTGKLRAVERYTDPLTEKQKKVSITIPDRKRKTLKEAEKALEQKIKDALEVKSDRLKLGELAELYLADCEKRLKPSSMASKRGQARLVAEKVGKEVYIDKLTARAVSDRLTAAGQVKTFKTMMRWAYKEDYIDSVSFLDKIAIPESNRREGKKYLESDELKEILGQIKRPVYRDLTEFLTLTGLRIGEALALTLDDINLKERIITVNKTYYASAMILVDTPKTSASAREVYIQDDLYPLAKKLVRSVRESSLLTQCRNIFQFNGKVLGYQGYKVMLERFGLHAHVFRHTHTALMAEKGVSLDVISRRLGHGDSQITREIYYHVTEKQKEKDHEAIRKISIF